MIQLDHISKSFGDHKIIHDITYTFYSGKVYGIYGPSGSGKSTLFKLICGLEVPSKGSIKIHNENLLLKHGIDYRQLDLRKHIGVVFQDFKLFNHWTALENISKTLQLTRNMSKHEAEIKARETLALVSMEEHASKLPGSLSGGQKQRVAIARALAIEPSFILMDEPTSALDPDSIKEVVLAIEEIKKNTAIGIILISHQYDVIETLCDTVLSFEHGNIINEQDIQKS